jgi:hypothetical protein
MDRYRDDPVGFNERVLRRSPYWWRQQEVARSIVDYRVTVCVTGNSVGKDHLLGGTIPWWVVTRRNALCICTAVSQTLLSTVTWKEVRRAVEGSPLLRALKLRLSSGVKASPQFLEVRPGWHALGYSTTTVERAAGQHAPDLLAIINEASGVPDEIYDAIDSLKYKRLVVFGNPIRAEGRFVELVRQAEKDRKDGIPPHKAVNAICIPSTDSPHAEWDESPWGLADKTWIDEMTRRYGKDSLWVRSHIRAEIPSVSADQLIPLPWLDWAAAQERDPSTLDPLHPAFATRRISGDLGEGVGRDSTSIFVTDDYGVLDVIYGDALDLPRAAYEYHRLGLKWGVPHERMSYDRIGIGRDFHLHLSRVGIREAMGFAGSGAPAGADFTNLRTEAAWRFRQRLDPQGADDHRLPHASRAAFCIPPGDYWPRLREELSKLTYHLVKTRIALLSKEDHAKVLGHSPDLSDGLCQRFGFA